VIWDSSYWKGDLLRRAASLERRQEQKRWPEASMARVEQDVMLGFFAIRKLIEASKVSDGVAGQTICLAVHPPTGKPVTKLNWHRVEQLFDLSQSAEEQRNLVDICHQVVHTYVFVAAMRESGGLDGFLFASDRQRHKGLAYLPVAEVIRLFRQVGQDYPNMVEMQWEQKVKAGRGDYQVVLRTLAGPHSEPETLP